jgi:hypothetical protein
MLLPHFPLLRVKEVSGKLVWTQSSMRGVANATRLLTTEKSERPSGVFSTLLREKAGVPAVMKLRACLCLPALKDE